VARTILLVDDDPDDLQFYKHLLAEIDPNLVAKDFSMAREALKYLETTDHLPDLVILDFNMPQMNGLEFVRATRANPSLAALRITVVTTTCNPRDVEDLKALGVHCHVKPSALNAFKTLVTRLIRRK
jgi:CheY-like chemotaxis protein